MHLFASGLASFSQRMPKAVHKMHTKNQPQPNTPIELKDPKFPKVNTCASLFQKFCYDYKDSLMAGLIIGGSGGGKWSKCCFGRESSDSD